MKMKQKDIIGLVSTSKSGVEKMKLKDIQSEINALKNRIEKIDELLNDLKEAIDLYLK